MRGLPPLAWCDHHWFKSRDDTALRATEQWRQDREDGYLAYYDGTDEGFFGRVEDPRVWRRWGAAVEARVRRLATQDGPCA